MERGISVHTRRAYARDLDHLAVWLEGRSKSLTEADTEDLVAFLEARTAQGDAPRTRARRAAALRSFYRFAAGENHVRADPARLLPSPRLPRLLPRALSLTDTERLLRAEHKDTETAAGAARLILELLYGCGLRASEAAGLRSTDFDLDGGFVRVTGKGGKARSVPISDSIRAALREYLRSGRTLACTPESADFLLLSKSGRPLTRAGIHAVVRQCAKSAGIRARLTPHTLRHTFATHLVKGGADLRAVQEMLGHASIDTTQIYTTLAEEHLHDAHRRFHPRG